MSKKNGNDKPALLKAIEMILAIVIAAVISGCGSWVVVRAYDGPKRHFEETAILFACSPPVRVTFVDNKSGKYPFGEEEVLGSCAGRLCEWHLLPGKHSITAYYEECTLEYGSTMEALDVRSEQQQKRN